MKIKTVITAGLLASLMTVTSSAILVDVNRSPVAFDTPPEMINSRVMVPMRPIFETLGADIEWNQATKTITATRGSDVIKMTIGSLKMTVNGKEVLLDVAPITKEGRTLVPVRAISEALNSTVDWDGTTRTVHILDTSGKVDVNASRKYIPQSSSFSANVGEVKGEVYCTQAVAGMNVLSVPTDGKQIASFCYYNGYIYYVRKDAATSGYTAQLCRCLPNGSELSVLAEDTDHCTDFIISRNILHWDDRYDGSHSALSVDLLSLQTVERNTPTYRMDGVQPSSIYDLAVYNDNYFYSTNNGMYKYENGTQVRLVNVGYGKLEGGVADGYLYYSVTQQGITSLYRVKIDGSSNSKAEQLDSRTQTTSKLFF